MRARRGEPPARKGLYQLDAWWEASARWLHRGGLLHDVNGRAPEDVAPWRSNALAVLEWCAPSVVWRVYGVPLGQVYTQTATPALANGSAGGGLLLFAPV